MFTATVHFTNPDTDDTAFIVDGAPTPEEADARVFGELIAGGLHPTDIAEIDIEPTTTAHLAASIERLIY